MKDSAERRGGSNLTCCTRSPTTLRDGVQCSAGCVEFRTLFAWPSGPREPRIDFDSCSSASCAAKKSRSRPTQRRQQTSASRFPFHPRGPGESATTGSELALRRVLAVVVPHHEVHHAAWVLKLRVSVCWLTTRGALALKASSRWCSTAMPQNAAREDVRPPGEGGDFRNREGARTRRNECPDIGISAKMP